MRRRDSDGIDLKIGDLDGFPDAPTARDRARLLQARRRRVESSSSASDAIRLVALRNELSMTIRSISPLALVALEMEGACVNDLVYGLRPRSSGWPGVSPDRWRRKQSPSDDFRRLVEDDHGLLPPCLLSMRFPGPRGRAALYLADHSVELFMTIGPTEIITRHGLAQVWLGSEVPVAILTGMVGRRLRDLVAHRLTETLDLVVVASRASTSKRCGPLLVVSSGSQPYSVPWPCRPLSFGPSATALPTMRRHATVVAHGDADSVGDRAPWIG